MRIEKYRASVGSHIKSACWKTSALAKSKHCRVRFNFNGVELEATPKKSPYTLLWEWENINEQRAATYRMSRKHQDYCARREAEVSEKQAEVNSMLAGLLSVLANMDATMSWLSRFAEIADDIDVHCNKSDVVRLFESAGYMDSDLVDEGPDSFNTRERLGRYIAGQAINCMKSGMPPHPCTIRFVKDYFAITA